MSLVGGDGGRIKEKVEQGVDEDTFQKLRRLLHNHAANSRDDEGALQAIIDGLTEAGRKREGSASKERKEGHRCQSAATSSKRRLQSGGGQQQKIEMRPGPTPYELWLERNGSFFDRSSNKINPPKLSNEDIDRFIMHLYTADLMKSKVLARQQHEQLAEELRNQRFHPELNPRSMELAADKLPLSQRQDGLIKTREDFLQRERAKKAEEEMKDCSFQPHIPSLATSQRLLEQTGNADRSHAYMEFVRYEQQRSKHRHQLKKALEERENKELTFSPTLTSSSSKLIARLTREGRFVMDERSRTINAPPRKFTPTMTFQDPGHEEETFTPRVTPKSARVARRRADANILNVYERLYADAQTKTSHAHNKQVQAYREKLRLQEGYRSFESTGHFTGTKAAWVEDVQQDKAKRHDRKVEETFDLLYTSQGEPDTTAVNVIPYSMELKEVMNQVCPGFTDRQQQR